MVSVDTTPTIDLPAIIGGAPYAAVLRLHDASGELIDLTGYHATVTVRNARGGALLAVLSDTNGHLALDPWRGTVQWLLSAAETAGITWATGHYDLMLADTTGAATLACTGAIAAIPGDTKPAATAVLPTA